MTTATVLGASGGIGQPLSLLLKLSPQLINQINLYDLRLSKGVSQDLSHINTEVQINGYEPKSFEASDKENALKSALIGSDIIIIPAGIPRKPGMSRDDLFKINAGIIEELAIGIAKYAPTAFVLVISNPVNSTVPIVKEVLSKHGVFNPQKLFGITTLDIVRANTFIEQIKKTKSSNQVIKNSSLIHVIGGHSGETIVPIYSKHPNYQSLSENERKSLINRVQFGGDEVVKAKNGAGSATLSMAFSGFKFAESLLKSVAYGHASFEDGFVYLDERIKGSKEVKEFITKTFGEDLLVDYISLPLKLTTSGAVAIEYEVLYSLNKEELSLLKIALGQLQKNIKKGVDFARFKTSAKL